MKKEIKLIFVLLIIQSIANGEDTNFLIVKEAVHFLIKDTSVYKNLQPCSDCKTINELKEYYENKNQPNSAIYISEFIEDIEGDSTFIANDYRKLVVKIENIIVGEKRAYRKESFKKDYDIYLTNIQDIIQESDISVDSAVNGNVIDTTGLASKNKQKGIDYMFSNKKLLLIFGALLGTFLIPIFLLFHKLRKLIQKVAYLEAGQNAVKNKPDNSNLTNNKEINLIKEEIDKLGKKFVELKNSINSKGVKPETEVEKILDNQPDIKIQNNLQPEIIKTIFTPIKYYARNPNNGKYHQDDFFSNSDNVEFFIDITIVGEDIGEMKLSTDNGKVRYVFRGDYRNYLSSDFCEIIGEYYHDRPYKVDKGLIKRENNQWVVNKKMVINFN